MTSMTPGTGPVTGGVDAHGQTHHAAVLDHVGRQLGDREFPTTPAGFRALGVWLSGHGQLERVGVEGTGTYDAGLTRHLRGTGVRVVEVDRPDRKARRAKGKSDRWMAVWGGPRPLTSLAWQSVDAGGAWRRCKVVSIPLLTDIGSGCTLTALASSGQPFLCQGELMIQISQIVQGAVAVYL